MAPRPPLDQRLRPRQRLLLRILAGAAYAAVVWTLFAHKITPWPLGVAAAGLVGLPVALAGCRPLVALAAGLVAFWATPVVPALAFLAVAPLGYTLYHIAGRYRLRTASWLLALGLTGPAATGLTGHVGGVLPFSVALSLAWTVGCARGEHRRYGAELVRHHAGQAAAERERARRSVAEERLRIARELHDVVAHSMSVITVQASYGHLVADEKPGEARQALAAIETTGRQALAELRHVLGVLRTPGEPTGLAPAPSLPDVTELVAGTRRAGVQVSLEVTGEPHGLPAAVQLTAYRILQEALTNVVNHARPATAAPVIARIAIRHDPESLRLEVTDDGLGAPAVPVGDDANGVAIGGLGLIGMRERARLYGGEVAAGPLPGRGFRVEARIPLPPPGRDDPTAAPPVEMIDAPRVGVERTGVRAAGAERVGAERVGAEPVGAERVGAERVDVERVDVERVDVERVDVERVDVERVDVERVDVEPVDVGAFGVGGVARSPAVGG